MLLCVCISVPLFTSCSEDGEEEENGLMGYWVDQDYESRWADQIKGSAEGGHREPYELYGSERRFINSNTLNDIKFYAYYSQRNDAVTTIRINGKTVYIVPEFEKTITYVFEGNKIICTNGEIYTMANGLLYRDNSDVVLTKLKKNNNDTGSDTNNTSKLAKDILGTWLDAECTLLRDISATNEYIQQGNWQMVEEQLLYGNRHPNNRPGKYEPRVSEGYTITNTSIHKFKLSINETQKSGLTTLKTFNIPNGTRYYLQMELTDECSYWLLPVNDDSFFTEDFGDFTVEYSGEDVSLNKYYEGTLWWSYHNINDFYDFMSQYSWIK